MLAIATEDQYLRAHTNLGSDLVVMRIDDAAILLEALPGARVHRSWRFARDTTTGSRSTNRNTMLEVTDDVEVQVSCAAKRDLAADGWFETARYGGQQVRNGLHDGRESVALAQYRNARRGYRRS